MLKLMPPVVAVFLAFLAPAALAQLNITSWEESLSFDLAPDSSYYETGETNVVPEPLSASFDGLTYSYSGSISFTSPGTPNVTCEVSGDYQTGLTTFGGTAFGRIEFQFRVQQTSPPPVSVGMVPVVVMASGSVQATGNGDLYASGASVFTVSTSLGPILNDAAFAENTGGSSSDSFFLNQQLALMPGEVVTTVMAATATFASFTIQDNMFATAFAYIDPVIEVADETIPGSGASYRDHYHVEFGSGYDALGSTPVRETTWGRIKGLYRD